MKAKQDRWAGGLCVWVSVRSVVVVVVVGVVVVGVVVVSIQ